jgi:hypothetical protein
VLKRYLIKLAIAAIFLLLFSLRFVDTTIGAGAWEDPLESGWKTTGLPLEEVSTETWLKLNDSGLTVAQLKQVARQIKAKLQVRLQTDLISGVQADYSFISFEGIRSDQTQVTVTIQSCRQPQRTGTQLGVYTSRVHPGANLRPYLDNLKTTFRMLGNTGNTAVIMSSKWRGELKRDEFKTLSRRVFAKLKAAVVEVDYQDSENSTYKGYTPALLKNPDRLAQYNVEFSARYDRQGRFTQVQLASPGEQGI